MVDTRFHSSSGPVSLGVVIATLSRGVLIHDERLASLRGLIAQLEPLNRALLLLYLEDRPYAEIAEVLGLSETNVATKLNRIKQRWREQMAPTSLHLEKPDGT